MRRKNNHIGLICNDVSDVRKMFILLFSLLVLFALSVSSIGAMSVGLSDQGTGVRDRSTGLLLKQGDLTVEVWDSPTGGNLIYSHLFVNAINNGSWNVMLGETSVLPLEFNKKYYKDYKINGEDVSFTTESGSVVDRQFFYSPLGDVGNEDINDNAITPQKLARNINLENATGYRWENIAGAPGISDSLWIEESDNDIYYSSGRVGVGTSPYGAYRFTVNGSLSEAAINNGVKTDYQRAILSFVRPDSSQWVSDSHYAASLVSIALANKELRNNASDPLDYLVALQIYHGIFNDSPNGYVTNSYGLYVTPYLLSGTIANQYDIYSASSAQDGILTGNRYGVYIAHPGLNYFAGNVGVGVPVPSSRLEVAGNAKITNITLTSSSTLNCDKLYTVNGVVTCGTDALGPGADSDWNISGNNIYSGFNGNIGIGNPSPSVKLDVNGRARFHDLVLANLSSCSKLYSVNGVVTCGDDVGSDSDWNLSGNNIYYGLSGNIGIGTSSPSRKLDVAGTARVNNLLIGTLPSCSLLSTDGTGSVVCQLQPYIMGSGSAHSLALFDAANVLTGSSFFETDGHIGIGSPSSSTYKVIIKGDVTDQFVSGGVTRDYQRALYVSANPNSSSMPNANGYVSGVTINTLSGKEFSSSANQLEEVHGLVVQHGIYANSPNANIASAYGISIYPYLMNGSIENIFDLYIGNTNSGTGTLTGKHYAIYVANPGDSYYNGKVGIGTSSPTESLDVVGRVKGTQLCIGSDCLAAWPSSGLSGTGSTNQVARFTSSSSLGGGVIFDTGSLVGIGTSSPSYKLSVVGDPLASVISVQDTSNRAVALSASNNVSGTYYGWVGSISNQDFRIGANSNNHLAITSSGNVGVGTTTPSVKLDVNGTVKANQYCIGANCLASWPASYWLSGTGGIFYSSGNVGIGTASPVWPLSIDSSSVALISLKQTASGGKFIDLGAGTGAAFINFDQSGDFGISSSATRGSGPGNYRMYIDGTTGNIGIGTISPTGKFDIVTSGAITDRFVVRDSDSAIVIDPGLNVIGSLNAGQTASFPLIFSASNFRFDNNIGVKTSTTTSDITLGGSSSTAIISMDTADGSDNKRLIITGGGYGDPSRGAYLSLNGEQLSSGDVHLSTGNILGSMYFWTGSHISRPARMIISDQGTVTINSPISGNALEVNGAAAKTGGGSWSTLSDARYKNVLGGVSGLSIVEQLDPIRFTWNENYQNKYGSNNNVNYGFTAQNVKKVLPEMVTKDEEGYYWVNPSGMEAVLTSAVKEQQVQIDLLKSDVDQLKKENTELKEAVCEINPKAGVCGS